jgi:hypothetical protein
MTTRIRQQAGSHRSELHHRSSRRRASEPACPRGAWVRSTCTATQYLWETSEVTRAANAVGQVHQGWMTRRIRQQADSHRSELHHRSSRRRASDPACPRGAWVRSTCLLQVSSALRYLWEMSEVTRVWAALRTNAIGQVHQGWMTRRIRQHAGLPRPSTRIKSPSHNAILLLPGGLRCAPRIKKPLIHKAPGAVETLSGHSSSSSERNIQAAFS